MLAQFNLQSQRVASPSLPNSRLPAAPPRRSPLRFIVYSFYHLIVFAQHPSERISSYCCFKTASYVKSALWRKLMHSSGDRLSRETESQLYQYQLGARDA